MCTALIVGSGKQRLLAANYDYSLSHGLVATNLRGTLKENGRTPSERKLQWEVKYGSVTFNSVSLELPTAGMNEQGLSIMLCWHDEGKFGAADNTCLLDPLQWIQFQLDNHSSIHDVINGLSSVQPKDQGVPLHFTLLDRNGEYLLLEFLDGDPVIYVNPDIPVLTNSTYERCLSMLKSEGCERAGNSLARFNMLAQEFPMLAEQSSLPVAFEALEKVQQSQQVESGTFPWEQGRPTTSTVWSMVFDPQKLTISYESKGCEDQRFINLAKLDFRESSEYSYLDIDEGRTGDVSEVMRPYRRDANKAIVEASATVIDFPDGISGRLVNLVDVTYDTRKMVIT